MEGMLLAWSTGGAVAGVDAGLVFWLGFDFLREKAFPKELLSQFLTVFFLLVCCWSAVTADEFVTWLVELKALIVELVMLVTLSDDACRHITGRTPGEWSSETEADLGPTPPGSTLTPGTIVAGGTGDVALRTLSRLG